MANQNFLLPFLSVRVIRAWILPPPKHTHLVFSRNTSDRNFKKTSVDWKLKGPVPFLKVTSNWKAINPLPRPLFLRIYPIKIFRKVQKICLLGLNPSPPHP